MKVAAAMCSYCASEHPDYAGAVDGICKELTLKQMPGNPYLLRRLAFETLAKLKVIRRGDADMTMLPEHEKW